MSLGSRALERRLSATPRARGRLRVPVLAGSLALLLAGCTGGLREDVARQDAGLAELRTGVESLRIDLRSLRDEVAVMRATLESGLGRAVAAREAEDARAREAQDALGDRLATSERRAEDLAEAVSGLEVAVAALAEQFARLEAGNVASSHLPPNRSGRAPPGGTSDLGRGALRSWHGELPGRGAGPSGAGLRRVRREAPDPPLAASAHFWIGEAYFRSRDFEHAAGEYQRAIDLAPSGERTPDALLRLGLALRSLRREDRAREVWARLVRDFPESEAAIRAQAVLRQPGRAVRPAEPR